MNRLPTKPKIKDTWYIILTDKYVLFRGGGIFKLEGESLRDFLEYMLPLLNGKHTLEDIVNTLSEYNKEDVLNALSALNKEGVLENGLAEVPENLSRSEIKRYRRNLEYFSLFSGDKYGSQGNLKRSRVAILGSGVVGVSIASSLAFSGVGKILLVCKREIKARDLDMLNGVSSTNNHVKVRILSKEIDYRSISGLRGKYDLVVCAPDTYSPSLLNLVNRACLESGIAWIPVYVFEGEGYLGPLVVSKEGPCYNCFEVRLLNNSEHIEENKVFSEYLLNNGQGVKSNVPGFYAEVISKIAVLEIVDFLSTVKPPSTAGNVYIQSFETLSGEVHRLIKVPYCPVCNGSGRVNINSVIKEEGNKWTELFNEKTSDGDISSLIQKLENLVDDRTGIIKRSLQSNSSKYLNLFGTHGWLVIGSPPNRLNNSRDFILSGGTGGTYEEAKCSALVEAVERYCCEGRDRGNFIRATYRKVRKYAVDPRDVVLFSGSQYSQENFPWRRFREDSPISWTSGFNLITKQPVLVPVDFVYTGIGQDRLCVETSNGAAAHTSRVEAILGGMYEIVERDGLMIMWFNRLPMPKIRVDSLPSDVLRIVKKVNEFGFEVIIQNITTDVGIPSFCVFMVNRQNKKPALFSGAGCHLNPEIALIKGLREALRFLSYHLSNPEKSKEVKTPEFDKLRSPEDHGNLYFDPEMLRHLDFVIGSEAYQDLDDVKDLWTRHPAGDLEYCLGVFRKKNMDIIVVDCTTRDMSDTGLCVIKMIIPGMQPIGFGVRNQRLGGRRLYDVPKELGYTELPTKEENLNMVPHFFA